jgi:Dihydrouridine synthase (Dus)/Inorganic pyrophosphatase
MTEKTTKSYDLFFSVAPMMDWTDRHCRVFHRLMTRRARLYTEMLTTGAILHGDRQRLLRFDRSEHPVALQLGGSDPHDLATAAKIGEDFGYDEINLNVGCPSDRVKDGRFGACLMAEPALVAQGVAAMKRAVKIPVTVKCRIGIDEQDPEVSLDALVLVGEPTFPGCRIRVRAVGVFHMADEKGPDEKVLCVPLNDPSWSSISDVHDVPPQLRNEIEHFFQVYKDLEDKKTETRGFGNRAEAQEIIAASRRRVR